MAEASIPVDLLNPGQVFACLGFVEAADALLGQAEARFEWTQSRSARARFALRAAGDESPIARVLAFLARASVAAELPHGSPLIAEWKRGWGDVVMLPPSAPYPFPEPGSPATARAVLRVGDQRLELDYWGDATRRDATKFWAGSGGYPGAALARDALELVRDRCVGAGADPFALAAPQTSSFRLDWRRDYIPIDAGFSLNNHARGGITSVGFPLVELLGAIGLSHARPERVARLDYLYGVVGRTAAIDWYPPSVHRTALGGSAPPFPSRRFRIRLGKPGKDDRAITTVTEETSA